LRLLQWSIRDDGLLLSNDALCVIPPWLIVSRISFADDWVSTIIVPFAGGKEQRSRYFQNVMADQVAGTRVPTMESWRLCDAPAALRSNEAMLRVMSPQGSRGTACPIFMPRTQMPENRHSVFDSVAHVLQLSKATTGTANRAAPSGH
jgi:hypothetical protein